MPSNRSCRMSIVACSAILLESLVIGIHIIHFRPQEVAYHRSVALAFDGYGNARFVLEEVRIDDSARPKSAPNSNFLAFGAGVSLDWYGPKQFRQFCLFTYPFIQKWASSLKMIYLTKFELTSNCFQNPISKHSTLSMVVYLKFLDQLNFIGVQTQVPMQNSPS